MNDDRRITIAGGGLAGLSLGIALRTGGVPVTILESGHYPRHRVCGEFISGVSTDELKTLGIPDVLDAAIPNSTTAWFMADQCFYENELPSPAMGISRFVLDQDLASRFGKLSGELKTGHRFDVNTSASEEGTVLASGRPRKPGSQWIGLKCHLRDFPLHADLEMHLGNGGYLGVSRIENGLANACGLFHVRRSLKAGRTELLPAYLNSCGLEGLANRILNAEIDEESSLGVSAFELGHQRSSESPEKQHLSIGDQFAIIGPFTGNGMSMAFQSAAIALKPVTAYARHELNWADCCAEVGNELKRNFRRRLGLSHILHPFLTESVRQKILVQLGKNGLIPFGPLFKMLR